jgi:hypothetical protein
MAEQEDKGVADAVSSDRRLMPGILDFEWLGSLSKAALANHGA